MSGLGKFLWGLIVSFWNVFFSNKSNDERLGKSEEQVEILKAREEAIRAMDLAEGSKTDEELDKKLREGRF